MDYANDMNLTAGFGTVVSIAIGLIFLLVRFINKSKASTPQQPPVSAPTSHSEAELPSFDELLTRLRLSSTPSTATVKVKPATVTTEPSRYDELHERSEVSDKGRFSDYSIKGDDENVFGEMLRNPDDLRNAVILSEVLTRKFD